MKHKLIILSSAGDERLTWDEDDPSSVNVAEEAFTRHVKIEGYYAFAFDEKGEGSMVEVFDKTATKIIVAPQISGG